MVEMAGFTFDRDRIGKILAEIERQKNTKKDFVGKSRYLTAIGTGKDSVRLGIEVPTFGGPMLEEFAFTRNGREQFAQALRIPMVLWDRMDAEERHREKLADLATHFLRTEPSDHLVRTLDGKTRAFLSPRYRMLDNADLFFVAAEEFEKAKAEIWEARLSEDAFRLYAVQPGIAARVDDAAAGDKFDAGGDHVAAVAISNSETGRGKLKIRPACLVKVCSNWNVWDESLAQIHLGRKKEEEGWISEDTQRLEDRVIWGKVKDVIRAAFDPKRFLEVIQKLRGAKTDADPEPVRTVEAAVQFADLPLGDIDRIRAKYIAAKDFTRYGLVQTITSLAHETQSDEEKDAYDDAGARVLATPFFKFR